MGAFVGFVAAAIMFYYSVVAGWCVYYLIKMATAPLPLSAEAAQSTWDGFQGGGFPVAFHALAMGLGAVVVWNGIRSIERANRVLIPALLLIPGNIAFLNQFFSVQLLVSNQAPDGTPLVPVNDSVP